jgi:membrane protease YdiL (CAAX protease family)
MMIEHKNVKFPWAFLLITFGFTWLVLLPGVLASLGLFELRLPMYALVALAQFGPSLTAFLLTFRSDGKAGAIQLLKRAFNFHIPWIWLVTIFLMPPLLAGLALVIHVLLGGQLPPLQLLAQPAAILPSFIFILLLQGPVPEEFGWRGYLLDRLQSRWSALIASLILGFFWWLWHLPANFMEGVAQAYLPQIPYLIWILAFSVLMTWIYNNTDGNLLAALLFHTMANLSNALFPTFELTSGGSQPAYYYLAALTVITATLVVAVWGPQQLRRQNKRVSQRSMSNI